MRPRGQVTAGVAGLGIAALDLFRCKDFLYAEVVSSPQGNFIAGWKRPLRWHCFLALVTRPPVDLVCSVNNVLGLFGEVPEDVDGTCPNFLFINQGDPDSGAATVIARSLPKVIHEHIEKAGWGFTPNINFIARRRQIVADHRYLSEQQLRRPEEKVFQSLQHALLLRRPYARMGDCCAQEQPFPVGKARSGKRKTSKVPRARLLAARTRGRILSVAGEASKISQLVVLALFDDQSCPGTTGL